MTINITSYFVISNWSNVSSKIKEGMLSSTHKCAATNVDICHVRANIGKINHNLLFSPDHRVKKLACDLYFCTVRVQFTRTPIAVENFKGLYIFYDFNNEQNY